MRAMIQPRSELEFESVSVLASGKAHCFITNIKALSGMKTALKTKVKMANFLNPLFVAATVCPNTTNFTEELRLHPGVVPYVSTCAQTVSPNAIMAMKCII